MGTTPTHGLPYPEPTDPVADGAAAIEALAEAVDTRLHGPGARLNAYSYHIPHTDIVMDSFRDNYHNDDWSYPFPTVTQINVTSIYIKPDRATELAALIYTTSLTEPGGAGGRTMDFQYNQATGATYYPFGTLCAAQPLAAGSQFIWVVRLQGVAGNTAASYSYSVTVERFAADAP